MLDFKIYSFVIKINEKPLLISIVQFSPKNSAKVSNSIVLFLKLLFATMTGDPFQHKTTSRERERERPPYGHTGHLRMTSHNFHRGGGEGVLKKTKKQ